MPPAKRGRKNKKKDKSNDSSSSASSPNSSIEMTDTTVQTIKDIYALLKKVKLGQDQMSCEITELKEKCNLLVNENQQLRTETEKLKGIIETQQQKLTLIDRDSARSKILISNIPYQKGEDLAAIFIKLTSLLQIQTDYISIKSIKRLGRYSLNTPSKPLPILAELNSTILRDRILQTYKKSGPVDHSLIGLNASSCTNTFIHFKEYHSRIVLALLKDSQILKEKSEYRFVWARNGLVFAKKSEDSNLVQRIRNNEDIKRIISEPNQQAKPSKELTH